MNVVEKYVMSIQKGVQRATASQRPKDVEKTWNAVLRFAISTP